MLGWEEAEIRFDRSLGLNSRTVIWARLFSSRPVFSSVWIYTRCLSSSFDTGQEKAPEYKILTFNLPHFLDMQAY